MPKFTIDLSEAAVTGLQALTARYNADNGTDLPVQGWLLLHLKELAVQDDLLRIAGELRRQAETDAQAAFIAERRRLLESVA